jgi:hypothetical protein
MRRCPSVAPVGGGWTVDGGAYDRGVKVDRQRRRRELLEAEAGELLEPELLEVDELRAVARRLSRRELER